MIPQKSRRTSSLNTACRGSMDSATKYFRVIQVATPRRSFFSKIVLSPCSSLKSIGLASSSIPLIHPLLQRLHTSRNRRVNACPSLIYSSTSTRLKRMLRRPWQRLRAWNLRQVLVHPLRPKMFFGHRVAVRTSLAAENTFSLRLALSFSSRGYRHRMRIMKGSDTDAEYSPEEAERRARSAIRRSFELPYKPHKELVGKTPRAPKRVAQSRTKKGSPESP